MKKELHKKNKKTAYYITNFEFANKSKACYNDLMCVVTDMSLADEFYYLTLNSSAEFDSVRILKFKHLCRKDIGLKTKIPSINTKNAQPTQINNYSSFASQPVEQTKYVPSQPITPNQAPKTEQPRPSEQVRPTTSTPKPMQRPVSSVQRPTQPATRPTPKPPVK